MSITKITNGWLVESKEFGRVFFATLDAAVEYVKSNS